MLGPFVMSHCECTWDTIYTWNVCSRNSFVIFIAFWLAAMLVCVCVAAQLQFIFFTLSVSVCFSFITRSRRHPSIQIFFFFTESIHDSNVCPPLPWKVKAINKDAKETSIGRLRGKHYWTESKNSFYRIQPYFLQMLYNNSGECILLMFFILEIFWHTINFVFEMGFCIPRESMHRKCIAVMPGGLGCGV